jgi:hypothetical protein
MQLKPRQTKIAAKGSNIARLITCCAIVRCAGNGMAFMQ